MPIAINQAVESMHCFDARFGASDTITSVGSTFMTNRFVAMLANTNRWLARMIEAVHFSWIPLTLTGPLRKTLCPKAARPAAPCTTYCYHAVGFRETLCLRPRMSAQLFVVGE